MAGQGGYGTGTGVARDQYRVARDRYRVARLRYSTVWLG